MLTDHRHGLAGSPGHSLRAVPGVVGILAWCEMNDAYRVVCGLFDQHPHHQMHSRPMDSYTAAVDLAWSLNDTAERCTTPTVADACTPHKVQQSQTEWRDV